MDGQAARIELQQSEFHDGFIARRVYSIHRIGVCVLVAPLACACQRIHIKESASELVVVTST